MALEYDVIVVGAGLMGCSIASACARRAGKKVLLIEQYDSHRHANGSSHGDGRIFRFAYSEHLYVSMMVESLVGWRKIQEEAGHGLFATTGGIDIGTPEYLTSIQAAFESAKLPYEVLSREQGMIRFPQLDLSTFSPTTNVLYQPDAGILFADRCLDALWDQSLRRGVETLTSTRVTAVASLATGGVSITTSTGKTITAKSLAFAGGAWTKQLAKLSDFDIPLEVTMESVAYFSVRDNVSAPDHTYKSLPIFIPWLHNGLGDCGYYGLPQVTLDNDSTLAGVKMGAHYVGPAIDPDKRPSDAEGISAIQSAVRLVKSMFPYLDATPKSTLTCLYTTTPDHNFLLGRHPRNRDIFIFGGGSGHSFKFGPCIGEIGARMCLNEPDLDRIPSYRSTFDPARFEGQKVVKKTFWRNAPAQFPEAQSRL